VLLVTHDLEAAGLADRHVTLRDGKLAQLPEPAEVHVAAN
jgi:ABC-type proline/glycine betaine transport system ATPase subunit